MCPGEITGILKQWGENPQASIEALTPVVYQELRKIAAGSLRGQRANLTLQPTALISEAYLRLVHQDLGNLTDRAHFFALAARMMRQILVDAARAFRSAKRGAGNLVPFDDAVDSSGEQCADDFLIIHDALERLQAHNPRLAQTIELRYFGGLLHSEIAESLSIAPATVKRDLALGEAWLRRALKRPAIGALPA